MCVPALLELEEPLSRSPARLFQADRKMEQASPRRHCLDGNIQPSVTTFQPRNDPDPLNPLKLTNWPSNELLLQPVDALTEREEDPVDVSFLQLEAVRHCPVADPLRQQRERQEDRVGQRQSSPSSHPSPSFGALQEL